MMTDIVERLRLLNLLFLGDELSQTAPLCNGTAQEMINLSQEAADEIERLRNALDRIAFIEDEHINDPKNPMVANLWTTLMMCVEIAEAALKNEPRQP